MAAEEPTFHDITTTIASRFLQTIIVVDDDAYIQEGEREGLGQSSARAKSQASGTEEPKIVEPSPRGESESTENSPDEQREPSTNHELDAKLLIDSFALKGLVCAVLAPGKDEDLVKHTLKVAKNADVVVLDWQIGGDDGSTARRIIKSMADEDVEHGGRLRLFVIYTGEPDLEHQCYDKVKQEMGDLTPAPGDNLTLVNKNIRISFVQKHGGETRGQNPTLSERELPDHIVREFGRFAGGLLSNAAMAAVSLAREHTHRILRRFSSELDGPYLSHRLLLESSPADAESYLFELIADEFTALLDWENVSEETVGSTALEAYINSDQVADDVLRINKNKQDDDLERSLTRKSVIGALQNGASSDVWGSRSSLHKRIHPLFHLTADSGRAGHQCFSRLSALRRELTNWPKLPNSSPRLSLGTIVELEGQYLICLQPMCDCIRLTCNTNNPFLFGLFEIDDKQFDLVVCTQDNENRCLRFLSQPFRTRILEFNPGEKHEVYAVVDNETWCYRTAKDERLIWIAELRPLFAQRLVQRIATHLARVGVDEFEWQRLFSLASD